MRATRAAVFAVVCVTLAALGHDLASGTAMSGWLLLGAFAVVAAVGWCLLARERGVAAVTACTAVTQALLHLAVSLPSASADPAGHGAAHHGAHHGAHSLGMHHVDGGAGDPSLTMSWLAMSAAHTLAALLSGVWLGHGERAVFRVLRSLAGWFVAPLRPLLLVPAWAYPPWVRCGSGADRMPCGLRAARSITSRGPPAATAVRRGQPAL